MRVLISSAAVLLCCLMAACPAAKNGNQQAGQQPVHSTADVPPESGKAVEVLRDELLDIRLASPFDNSGSSNYSQSGDMLLGGEEASSISYEIGRLRNGDQLEKLTLDLRPGRQPGSACRLRIASTGSEVWKDFDLKALDHPQEVILVDQGIGATNEGSFILRFECAPGNGIAIGDISAALVLSSQPAQRIEIDLPQQDIRDVNIRIPMRALDVDGRIASSYGGTAQMLVTSGELTMKVPLAFSEGLSDCSFSLSTPGDYDVQFICELQEPVLAVLNIRECGLPVYELQVQQALRDQLSSLDLPAMESFGSLTTADAGTVRASVSGLPLDVPDTPWRPLRLDFPDGLPDPGFSAPRRAAELRRCGLDPLMLREPLAAWLAEGCSVEHMRVRPVHLRINGVYQGVYIDAEVPDGTWLDSRSYPGDSELYVMTGNAGLNPREDISFYDGLYQRVRQPEGGMQALSDKLRQAGSLYVDHEDFERFGLMSEDFDNGRLVDCFLLYSLCSAQENYRSHYALLDPGNGGGWSLLPTDMALSLGINRSVNPVLQGAAFSTMDEMDMIGSIDDNILLRTVLSSVEGQQLLYDRMLDLMEGALSAEQTLAELERLWAAQRAELLADPRMEYTAEELEAQVEMLRGNIRTHWAYLLDQPRSGAGHSDEDSHAGHDH
ncbi:CotH kinase family protein [bacterium]|nr:CotH kinase family protein [bacterium]